MRHTHREDIEIEIGNPMPKDTMSVQRYAIVEIPYGAEPCVENAIDAMAIDVFPHRVTPKTSMDDFISGLVAECWLRDADMISRMFRRIDARLKDVDTDEPLILPTGVAEPGGLVLSLGLQSAENVFFVHKDAVFALDHKKYDVVDFKCPTDFQFDRFTRASSTLSAMETDPRLQVMLSLLASFLPRKVNEMRDIITTASTLMARISRLVQINTPSGAAGSEKAINDFEHLYGCLSQSWSICPNRPWAPSTMDLSENCRTVADNLPSDIRQLTNALVEIMDTSGDRDLLSFATTGDKVGVSNHHLLQIRATVGRIDSAIIQKAPLSLLKPGAARKRKALKPSIERPAEEVAQ